MSLSDARLRSIDRDGYAIFYGYTEADAQEMAGELLSRREQDEVVGKLWKVAEWAAKQPCINPNLPYGAGPPEECEFYCGPCLARTLQSKRKEPTS